MTDHTSPRDTAANDQKRKRDVDDQASRINNAVTDRDKAEDDIHDQEIHNANDESSENDHQDDDEDDEDGDEDEDEDEDENEPPYTAQEIAATIRSFYEFLTTLHFAPEDLKTPPTSGWQHIQDIIDNNSSSSPKSDLVLEVLKHLPYFKTTAPAQILYKSRVRDYSEFTSSDADDGDEYFEEVLADIYNEEDDEDNPNVTLKDILIIVDGHESGGRTLVLVPKTGEIIDEVLRCNTLGPFDLVEYFNGLKTQYRNLELIGGVGKNVIDSHDGAYETTNDGSAAEFNVPYLKEIYRRHGWPDDFQRVAATNEVREWMDKLRAEDKDEWEDDVML